MLTRLHRTLRRHPTLSVVVLSLIGIFPLVAAKTASWAEGAALAQVEDRARRTLDLTRAGLASEIRRHESVPLLLAMNAGVGRFLASERPPGEVGAMNRLLAAINAITGSADTYLMDPAGLTLAASNWDGETPFVGRNFAYRPYFTQALGGALGRYFALGTTSRRRGYYFAAPVRDGASVLGVIAVKVDVAPIERRWAEGTEEVLVSDADGVVFMSSRPEWVLHSLGPLGEAARARLRASRRYDGAEIGALGLEREPSANGSTLFRDSEPTGGGRGRFLAVSALMPETDWTLHVLADTAGVRGQVQRAVAGATLGFAFLVLLAVFVLQRRQRIKERLESTAAARLELEHRVRERTVDLENANRQLTGEIAEREAAERELRRAQRELIQASKLSALGEMSAGISHELNQPLAAIRSFAENADEFLARGRTDDARGNLSRIGALTERMARIIADLRTFARKDPEAPGSVDLWATVEEALALLAARIDDQRVEIARPQAAAAVCVRAEPTRLQQVLVNVIGNALDALRGVQAPRLELDLEEDAERVTLTVRDNGPGIAPTRIGDIFDPFFTTKDVDQGLGLGLSISYGIVTGFGGSIRAHNDSRGGAAFTITLPRAEARPAEAARRAG